MGREAFYLRDKGQKVKSDCVSSNLYQNLNFIADPIQKCFRNKEE